MTKFTQQDLAEKEGRNIFLRSLASNFFEVQDWGLYAKDKYPDIDGQIRLMDGSEKYLNHYLHYQLKSKGSVKNNKFFCSRDIIDYLLDTNVPTLLIVVDVSCEKVFWYFLDSNTQKKLNLKKDKKGRTLNLTEHEIARNSPELNQLWQTFAKEDDYKKKRNALDEISSSFQQNLENCVGVLYLQKKANKTKLSEIFQNLLNIDLQEANLIIDRLCQQDVITSTTNLYLLENDKLGEESLYNMLDDFNLKSLEKVFPQIEEKANIFAQLAKVDHPKVHTFLSDLAKKLARTIKAAKTNDNINELLILLHQFSFRVPNGALSIFEALINKRKPLPPDELPEVGLGLLEGKTHEDILKKVAEIIPRVCFFDARYSFKLVQKLYNHQNEKVREKAKESLGELCGYHYEVLSRIGYAPQIELLDEIASWSKTQLKKNLPMLLSISKNFMQLEIMHHTMVDYNSFSWGTFSIPVNSDLKKVRESSINLLKKLFSISECTEEKRDVIKIMEESSQTPIKSSYSEDMEKLIQNNISSIVEYYINIVPTCENSTIQAIENQAIWFSKWIGSDKITKLKELKALISESSDYELFRVLVGNEWRKAENLPWQEAYDKRMQKVVELVAGISEVNFEEWKTKLNSIKSQYNPKRAGEFQYFNILLNKFGRSCPDLALKVIEGQEEEWEEFLIQIIGGVWEGGNKELALKKLNQWTGQGKFLTVCTGIHSYVRELETKLLKESFQQAKTNNDLDSLINVIGTVIQFHKKRSNLTSLAVESIKILSQNQDIRWMNIGFRDSNTFYQDLSEKEVQIILKSLILTPRIDSGIEEILRPLLAKYPKKVIDFFQKRVSSHSKRPRDFQYDAIPFSFYYLIDTFEKQNKTIIPLILSWYKKGPWIYRWEASHFLKAAFPGFHKNLERELIRLINTGREKETKIAISVLEAYQGENFIHKTCQAIIKRLPNNRKIFNQLFYVLSKTGVVSGEYGFVKAFEAKKEEIKTWKSLRSKAIQSFVEGYEDFLDEEIDRHKKRADEEIEVRKREFN